MPTTVLAAVGTYEVNGRIIDKDGGFTDYSTTITVDAPPNADPVADAGPAQEVNAGDTVTLDDAVAKRKASACWEGVRGRAVAVPLVVEKVSVRGVRKVVDGSIAFVPTTQSWLAPMRRVWDGVLGSQDVNICR